jgi:hypothetical protein
VPTLLKAEINDLKTTIDGLKRRFGALESEVVGLTAGLSKLMVMVESGFKRLMEKPHQVGFHSGLLSPSELNAPNIII